MCPAPHPMRLCLTGVLALGFALAAAAQPTPIPEDEGPHAFVFESREEAANLAPGDCLACHEPTTAPDAETGHIRRGPDGQVRLDHPYDVAYQVTNRNRLRPPGDLIPGSDAHVSDLLRDGKMHCTSCHALFRSAALPGTRLLRAEFGRAESLCLACHRL